MSARRRGRHWTGSRTYDAYGRLVGVPADEQGETRAELDKIGAELVDYYDESFDVARTRTGATVRRERRKAVRRVREELQQAPDKARTGLRQRVASRLRKDT